MNKINNEKVFSRSKSIAIGLVILAVVLISDQYTKQLVLKHIGPGEVIAVIDNYFNLILTYNTGVAFGMLSTINPDLRVWLLGAITLFAFGFIIYLFLVSFKSDMPAQLALSAILGGALGNIIDRFQHGAVVDFLDFYYGNYHWPAFNVADSAICIGVFILLFRNPGPKQPQAIPENA